MKEIAKETTWTIAAFAAVLVLAISQSAVAQAPAGQTAGQAFKNVQVLKDIPTDQLLPTMQFFEGSLGVTCNFCHDAQDRTKDDKPQKLMARKMIAMVRDINKNTFNGERTVTCNSCHRGRTQPEATPELATANYKPWEPDSPNGTPNARPIPGPPADQLIDSYLKALGGLETLNRFTSRVVKYTVTDSVGRTVNGELISKGDNAVQINHTPNGDFTVARTGGNGWLRPAGANAQPRDTRLDELDNVRLQDLLYLAKNLRQNLSQLETRQVNLDGLVVYQLRGMAFGHLPVRLSFHRTTGNLLRLVYLVPNGIGQNITRIDFADYRDLQGTRYPFKWTIARALGYQTVIVDQVQHNVSVEDSRFTRPAAAPAR